MADELPADARQAIETAASHLGVASTPAARAGALREIAAFASAHEGVSEADVVATLTRQMATMESAPETMLSALADLASGDQRLDSDIYAAIARPLMETLAALAESGALLPEAAVALDDALQRLNAAAENAGLPGVSDLFGDSSLGDALDGIANLARIARQTQNLANLNQQQTRDYIDALVGLAGAAAGPAINSPAFVLARDAIAWTNEMTNQSTSVMEIVADTIETGQFDQAAYDRARQRLMELSHGPWNSQTARDVCGAIPVLGEWCDELFELAEIVAPGPCREAATKVPATEEWTHACAWVPKGATVSITARGTVRYSAREDAPGAGLSPPGGVPVNSGDPNDFRAYTPWPFPHIALLGRVGEDGTPFLVGIGAAVVSAEAGELLLGVNDNDTGNNSGAYDVEFSLTSPSAN